MVDARARQCLTVRAERQAVNGTGVPFVKKKARASQCFKRFYTAERTLEGIEAVNMMREGQVKRLAGSDARGRATFVASLFGIAA